MRGTLLADLKSHPRSQAKRVRIVERAMARFAEDGYEAARVEDVARELGIAKGSIFQHFGSKAGLFLECYRHAVASLPAWLDVPEEVKADGFFAVVTYWLERTEHLIQENRIPFRVVLIGDHGSDLALKREINRFLMSEDPHGTREFVEWGRSIGEVRTDVDLELIVSIVDWLSDRLQDALMTEGMDPGLSHGGASQPERQRSRLEDVVVVLRSALGSAGSARSRQRRSA